MLEKWNITITVGYLGVSTASSKGEVMHRAGEASKVWGRVTGSWLAGGDTPVFPHLHSYFPGGFGLGSWMSPFQGSVVGTGKLGKWKKEVKAFQFSIPAVVPSVPGLPCPTTV